MSKSASTGASEAAPKTDEMCGGCDNSSEGCLMAPCRLSVPVLVDAPVSACCSNPTDQNAVEFDGETGEKEGDAGFERGCLTFIPPVEDREGKKSG